MNDWRKVPTGAGDRGVVALVTRAATRREAPRAEGRTYAIGEFVGALDILSTGDIE